MTFRGGSVDTFLNHTLLDCEVGWLLLIVTHKKEMVYCVQCIMYGLKSKIVLRVDLKKLFKLCRFLPK